MILIGMRKNLPESRLLERWYAEFVRGKRSADALLRGMVVHGARLDRLRELGLEWKAAANLLPPAQQCVPWDATLARMVASAWRPLLVERYSHVLLAGTAVRQAFGLVDARVGDWTPPFLICPHPSGRSRWWNDPNNIEAFREKVRETL